MNLKTNFEDNFIQMLADECSKAIMSLTTKKEYSAMQLSRELNIPSTTVYRKLKFLEEADMIQNVKTLIDRSGNEERYYRCIIQEAVVKFNEGRVLITIKRVDLKDKFVKLWKKLSTPEH
ncbi:MAG: winged helix-turn-helix transcriptional regulator [Candidatus Methanoperedens sp.]|nr:winged helix-turn-helix transcriptional regulator [Candidatus Methanoperedens sp.]